MNEPWRSALVGCAGLGAVVIGAVAMFGERRTTLFGSWLWALVASSSVCGLWLLDRFSAICADVYWFAAGSLLFCPNVFLLGAKRPQHRPWHYVVLTLWFILALPPLVNMWLYPGREATIGLIRGGFVWLLIGLEIVNGLAAGWGVAGALMGAAELAILGAFLPGCPWGSWGPWAEAAIVWIASAYLCRYIRERIPPRGTGCVHQWWLRFRRRFGLLWALRVRLQINSLCQTQGWPVRLTWRGFVDRQGAPVVPEELLDPAAFHSLRQALINILTRFEDASVFKSPSVHSAH